MSRSKKTMVEVLDSTDLDSPGALAKITVSLSDKRILDVKLKREKPFKMKSRDRVPEDAGQLKEASEMDAVQLIWKMLNEAKIDIGYACIGYALDGRPVLNYRNFMDLLVVSGFTPGDATAFIDDFAKHSKKVKTAPIIMTDTNTGKILTEVTKIA